MKPAKVELVHYEYAPSIKRRSENDPLFTVCKPSPWPGAVGSVLRTRVPRCVTCPACLDWIAANHQKVAADVARLRGAA